MHKTANLHEDIKGEGQPALHKIQIIVDIHSSVNKTCILMTKVIINHNCMLTSTMRGGGGERRRIRGREVEE